MMLLHRTLSLFICLTEASVESVCEKKCGELTGSEATKCASKCGECVKFAKDDAGSVTASCQAQACGGYSGADKDLCDNACTECDKFADVIFLKAVASEYCLCSSWNESCSCSKQGMHVNNV